MKVCFLHLCIVMTCCDHWLDHMHIYLMGRTMNLSEAEDQITMGIRASGEMDSDQTRQALHLAASSQSEWHVRLCLAIAYIRILDLQMHMSFVTLALLVWCIQHVEFELFVCLLCTGSIHSGYCTVGGIQGSFHLVVIWPTFKRRGWDHMILHPCPTWW